MDPERRTAFPGLQGLAARRQELVKELAKARQERGLSQTEIAARMGTSQSAVARLERGDLDVRFSTLDRTYLILNIAWVADLRVDNRPA